MVIWNIFGVYVSQLIRWDSTPQPPPKDGSWSKQRMRLAQIVRSQTFETIMGVVIVLTVVYLGWGLVVCLGCFTEILLHDGFRVFFPRKHPMVGTELRNCGEKVKSLCDFQSHRQGAKKMPPKKTCKTRMQKNMQTKRKNTYFGISSVWLAKSHISFSSRCIFDSK